jgi:hypothetical protein
MSKRFRDRVVVFDIDLAPRAAPPQLSRTDPHRQDYRRSGFCSGAPAQPQGRCNHSAGRCRPSDPLPRHPHPRQPLSARAPNDVRNSLEAVVRGNIYETLAADDERARRLALGRLPLSTRAGALSFAMYTVATSTWTATSDLRRL